MVVMMMMMMMMMMMTIVTIWKLNNLSMYTLVISVEEAVTKNFLQYLENIGLTKKQPKSGKKAVLLQMCHTECP